MTLETHGWVKFSLLFMGCNWSTWGGVWGGLGERGALGGIKVDQPGPFFSLLGQRKGTMSDNIKTSAYSGDGQRS